MIVKFYEAFEGLNMFVYMLRNIASIFRLVTSIFDIWTGSVELVVIDNVLLLSLL